MSGPSDGNDNDTSIVNRVWPLCKRMLGKFERVGYAVREDDANRIPVENEKVDAPVREEEIRTGQLRVSRKTEREIPTPSNAEMSEQLSNTGGSRLAVGGKGKKGINLELQSLDSKASKSGNKGLVQLSNVIGESLKSLRQSESVAINSTDREVSDGCKNRSLSSLDSSFEKGAFSSQENEEVPVENDEITKQKSGTIIKLSEFQDCAMPAKIMKQTNISRSSTSPQTADLSVYSGTNVHFMGNSGNSQQVSGSSQAQSVSKFLDESSLNKKGLPSNGTLNDDASNEPMLSTDLLKSNTLKFSIGCEKERNLETSILKNDEESVLSPKLHTSAVLKEKTHKNTNQSILNKRESQFNAITNDNAYGEPVLSTVSLDTGISKSQEEFNEKLSREEAISQIKESCALSPGFCPPPFLQKDSKEHPDEPIMNKEAQSREVIPNGDVIEKLLLSADLLEANVVKISNECGVKLNQKETTLQNEKKPENCPTTSLQKESIEYLDESILDEDEQTSEVIPIDEATEELLLSVDSIETNLECVPSRGFCSYPSDEPIWNRNKRPPHEIPCDEVNEKRVVSTYSYESYMPTFLKKTNAKKERKSVERQTETKYVSSSKQCPTLQQEELGGYKNETFINDSSKTIKQQLSRDKTLDDNVDVDQLLSKDSLTGENIEQNSIIVDGAVLNKKQFLCDKLFDGFKEKPMLSVEFIKPVIMKLPYDCAERLKQEKSILDEETGCALSKKFSPSSHLQKESNGNESSTVSNDQISNNHVTENSLLGVDSIESEAHSPRMNRSLNDLIGDEKQKQDAASDLLEQQMPEKSVDEDQSLGNDCSQSDEAVKKCEKSDGAVKTCDQSDETVESCEKSDEAEESREKSDEDVKSFEQSNESVISREQTDEAEKSFEKSVDRSTDSIGGYDVNDELFFPETDEKTQESETTPGKLLNSTSSPEGFMLKPSNALEMIRISYCSRETSPECESRTASPNVTSPILMQKEMKDQNLQFSNQSMFDGTQSLVAKSHSSVQADEQILNDPPNLKRRIVPESDEGAPEVKRRKQKQ